jgi:DNA polymerase-3 subunit beta
VTLSCEQEQLTIVSMDTLFTINTLNPVDFPAFPQIIPVRSLVVPAELLDSAVKKVAKAVSRDESRAVLTGIFLKAEEDLLQLVATDSYRLAVTKAKTATPSTEPMEIIVPGSVLEEVARLSDKEEITIGESENQIIFLFGNTTFISRKIEGAYPNYEQIIPSSKEITATIETELLMNAVKRASILAQTHTPIKLSLDPTAQIITVFAQSNDVGTAEEKVPAQIDGEPMEIGFNNQYIIDGLNAVDTEEVLFEAQNSNKPGIFKTVGEEYYFYLTMPLRPDY